MAEKHYALRICAFYLIFGVFWVSLSDWLAGLLNAPLIFSVFKGWLFVGITTALLYSLSHRYIQRLAKTNRSLQEGYDELTAMHEELTATEEELRQQFDELQSLNAKVWQQLQTIELKETTIRQILDSASDALFVHNAHTGRIESINSKARNLFGYELAEYQKRGLALLQPEPDAQAMLQLLNRVKKNGTELIEWSALTKAGVRLHLDVNLAKAVIREEECIIASVRDVTERKKTMEELARTQRQKLALLKALPDLILLLNEEGIFLDYNQPVGFELAAEPEAFLGRNMSEFFSEKFCREALQLIHQTIATGAVQFLEYDLLLKDDLLHYFEARFVKVNENEVLAMIRDITYKKKLEQRLEYLSFHDMLTGVYNRVYFEEEKRKINDKSDNEKIGIFVCDVDGLKLINDTLGHPAGDELLKTVATLLLSCIGELDTVARIGGDEFAIIVYDTSREKMEQLSITMQQAVKDYNLQHIQFPLSLSVGWSASRGKAMNIDELFKEADNHMYRQKMHQSLSTHSSIVHAMMQALEARDHITEGHADRLQLLIEYLAEKMKFPMQNIADLQLFAQFHDIGKVGIPDQILFKAGKLTPDEIEVMRRHCEIGFRIAKSAPDLAPIADWILKHQEWWNGQGYPLGIAGKEIPLECRMLALADAFDAMTNDRPYRRALPWQKAVAELKACSGRQFDPKLTQLFVEMIEEHSASILKSSEI